MAHGGTVEPPCVVSPLLEELRRELRQVRAQYDPSNFTIRGVWTAQYWLKLLPTSTAFNLAYLLVQTEDIGCCYVPTDALQGLDAANLIGASIFDRLDHPALALAAVDAGFGCLPKHGRDAVIEGRNYEKAPLRARLICEEVKRLLPDPESPRRIGMVGVVGEVMHELRGWPGTQIRATDFAPAVAGSSMEGVTIEWGLETVEMVESVDVAIVTGMTLANGSLEDILRAASRADTRLVVFAETGHNLGPKYLQRGADVVIAEDFPFYLSAPGRSRFRIERKGEIQS